MALPESVRSFDILNGLEPAEVDEILAHAEQMTIPRGDIVFEESSQDTDLYILLDGRVSVELRYTHDRGKSSQCLELALFRTGDIFGEVAFLQGTRRSAQVSAIDEIRVLRLSGKPLFALFEENHRLGYRFMRNLARILAGRMETINLKHRDNIRA
jgi:CRP-like cAMP-binding protein